MRWLFTAVAVTWLAGCMTQEELYAQDDAYCRSLSATPGTDAYVQCRFVLDQRRRAAQDAAAYNMGRAIGMAMAR